MKAPAAILALALLSSALLCTACRTKPTPNIHVSALPFSSDALDSDDYYAEYADAPKIELSHGSPEEITTSGAYRFSGSLSDGAITVNVDKSADSGTVFLILDGVDITSTATAPIYIAQAKKAVIILENYSKVTQTVDTAADNSALPSAAIFSKADLTITGDGTLEVTTNYNDGITSRDELIVNGGNIIVNAAYDGIVGKDTVTIADTSLIITAGKDGIRSTNDEDAQKGYVAIYGGSFVISSGDDCIQAASALQIHGGSFELTAGRGNENSENVYNSANDTSPDTQPTPRDNSFTPPQNDDSQAQRQPPQSNADFASPEPPQNGENNFSDPPRNDKQRPNGDGSFDGQQDFRGFEQHSNGPSPKGLVCDGEILITDGQINILASYEGIEGAKVTIDGGDITIKSDDDGVNVDVYGGEFIMNGGRLVITAGGDGIDSNGTITLTDGDIIIDKSAVGRADTPIDHETGFTQSGGTITDTNGGTIEVSDSMPGGFGGRGHGTKPPSDKNNRPDGR